jgi:hypothetical protein
MKYTIEIEISDDISPDVEMFKRAKDWAERGADHNWFSSFWHISDVQEVRQDLSDEQARDVLRFMEHYHDANIGINWDFIEACIDDVVGS